eukprot:scpid77313/ scgid15717/ 
MASTLNVSSLGSLLLSIHLIYVWVLLVAAQLCHAAPGTHASSVVALSRQLRGDAHRHTSSPSAIITLAPNNPHLPVHEGRNSAAYDRLNRNSTVYKYFVARVRGAVARDASGEFRQPTEIPVPPTTSAPTPVAVVDQGEQDQYCSTVVRRKVIRFQDCLPVTIDVGGCQGSCDYNGDFPSGNLTLGRDDVYRFTSSTARNCRCCKISHRASRYHEFLCAPPPGEETMVRVFAKIEVVTGCRCRKCVFKRA